MISSDNNGALVKITTNLPKRCLNGYVWREATSDDFVCVPVATRTTTRIDNMNQWNRKNIFGGCNSPWVRRQATPTDTACV